jgi:hypothetical protein
MALHLFLFPSQSGGSNKKMAHGTADCSVRDTPFYHFDQSYKMFTIAYRFMVCL